MSNDKQTTAVQWLMPFIEPSLTDEQKQFFSLVIKQAKERERQQIEDAYKEAVCIILCEEVCPIDECNAAFEYYEDKFTQ